MRMQRTLVRNSSPVVMVVFAQITVLRYLEMICMEDHSYILVRDMDVMWIFTQNDLHSVTTNPVRICICFNSIPLCNVTEYKVNKIFLDRYLRVRQCQLVREWELSPPLS